MAINNSQIKRHVCTSNIEIFTVHVKGYPLNKYFCLIMCTDYANLLNIKKCLNLGML